MSLTELTGLPEDPNCLHCHLAPIIERWRAAHPQKPIEHAIQEIAQVLGELVGSAAYDLNRADCIDSVLAGVMRIASGTAKDLIAMLRRRS